MSYATQETFSYGEISQMPSSSGIQKNKINLSVVKPAITKQDISYKGTNFDLKLVPATFASSQPRISNPPQTIVKIEADFYCVISRVDNDKKELQARVYDQKEKVQVMDICIPFSSFSPDDILRINENSIFYWKIGTRTSVIKSKKNGTSKISNNFSEYRMRLRYVSKRAVEERLQPRIQRFEKVFSL